MSTLTSIVGGRRWAVRATIVVGLLALIAATVAVVPAFGTDEGPHPHVSEHPTVGVLSLHLGDDGDYFEYRAWDNLSDQYDVADDPADQLITVDLRCRVDTDITTDDAEDLATIASLAGERVGLHNATNNLGIQDANSRNIHCGQVDFSEGVLSIALADGPENDGPLFDKEIDYAEVDFDVKQGVVILGAAFLDDIPVWETVILSCADNSDCGPDATGGDNERVIIAAALPEDHNVSDGANLVEVPSVWDRLDLWVQDDGAFSLGGGFEAVAEERGPLGVFLADTDDTLFHITDLHACNGDPILFADQGFVGQYELLGCDGAKGIRIQAVVEDNEITIHHSGPALDGAFSIENWTFLPAPTDAQLEYDDGFHDGPDPADPDPPPGTWFHALFCLDDPRPDIEESGFDPFDYLPPIDVDATSFDEGDPLNRAVHTTCIITETKTTVGPVDFGSGPETAIRYEVWILSIADSGRGFR